MTWEIGEIPHGWTRGERLMLVPPCGRFRGFVHLEQDVHGFPVLARARAVPMQVEFSAANREKVEIWLEWWRAPQEVTP